MSAKHIADQLFEIEDNHLLMIKAGNFLLEQAQTIDNLWKTRMQCEEEVERLQYANANLRGRVKELEAQVYGGTTK